MNAISSGLSPSLLSVPSGAGDGAKSAEQMKELGTQFESVFVSMLLKEMRQSLDEGFFGGEASDSFGGMFDMFIGQHLAKSSPIGIGDMMVQQYSKHQAANAQAAGGQAIGVQDASEQKPADESGAESGNELQRVAIKA